MVDTQLIFFRVQVAWISFNSTTTDSSQTLRQFGSGGTFFKLLIRNGRDISPLSLFAEESELLLLPNSVFKVLTVLSSREVNSRAVPMRRAFRTPALTRSPISGLAHMRQSLPRQAGGSGLPCAPLLRAESAAGCGAQGLRLRG